MADQFYRKQYFDNLNERLDNIESKLDAIKTQVTWIYATASAVGFISSLVFNIFIKKLG